jgi:hypothetical protein
LTEKFSQFVSKRSEFFVFSFFCLPIFEHFALAGLVFAAVLGAKIA